MDNPFAIDRAAHEQHISSSTEGDCFRASMSVLLGVKNGDHMPNDHSGTWWWVWRDFLNDFGMALCNASAKGPIWKYDSYWIASVPSKNYSAGHAIVMYSHQVAFDPSFKRRYRARMHMLGQELVHNGTWLEVADARKLPAFVEWQKKHKA